MSLFDQQIKFVVYECGLPVEDKVDERIISDYMSLTRGLVGIEWFGVRLEHLNKSGKVTKNDVDLYLENVFIFNDDIRVS